MPVPGCGCFDDADGVFVVGMDCSIDGYLLSLLCDLSADAYSEAKASGGILEPEGMIGGIFMNCQL